MSSEFKTLSPRSVQRELNPEEAPPQGGQARPGETAVSAGGEETLARPAPGGFLTPPEAAPPRASGQGTPQEGAGTDAPGAGVTLGKYELLEELGRGGMGVVYKARQRDLDRLVAVKMVLPSHLAPAGQVERFRAEARAAAKLRHPHIVHVYEAGEVAGHHYFAMELVTGPSLAAHGKRQRATPEHAAELVAKIARAVGHLHAHGIVHRDLKPSNILLRESGQPCVTDFGLVKVLEADSGITATGSILGTPSYMAPEQAAGRVADVGPLSDVYSLGAILYELITGRPPFQEKSALDTLVQVLEGEPQSPSRLNPSVPKALESICLKCLSKDPGDRYPSAEALAEDLERFLDGDAVAAQPLGPRRRVEHWLRREPVLAVHLIPLSIAGVLTVLDHRVYPEQGTTLLVTRLAVEALWMLASVLCQMALRRGWGVERVQMAWSAVDFVLLALLTRLRDGVGSSIVIVYGLLICGAGLSARPRLVWFATGSAVLAYGTLALDAFLRGRVIPQPYSPPYTMMILVMIGLLTALQARRLRVLGRHLDQREKS